MDEITFRRTIEEVRERIDIAELIAETVKIEPAGSVLKGRSPFNTDQNPSLVVWPHTNSWRDFSGGSSIGGDCFDFIEKRDGIEFIDALRLLAARAGVEVPGSCSTEVFEELRRFSERRRIQDLLTTAAAYYHQVLPSKVRSAWYNEKYGFMDETIDTLLLGWTDGHLFEKITDLLEVTPKEALATGLFIKCRDGRIQDFFCNRLIFPYWKNGRVVYFIARATEHTGDEPWDKAKYKKLLTYSDRHPYVSRFVANDTFYNEDAIRGAKELLITEGVTDCISAIQAGVACISPVTVRFRKKDQEKLITLTERCDKIVICNDTEESGAGESGAIETAQALYAQGRDVRIAIIDKPQNRDKIDLNELVAEKGGDALKALIKKARPLPEHLIERIPADTSKNDLYRLLKPVLDTVRCSDPLVQESYTDLLQSRFKLKTSTIKDLLRAPRKITEANSDEKKIHQQDIRKGEVHEDTNHYYIYGKQGEVVVVSSFQIEPRRKIVVENGEIIDADVYADRGTVYRSVRFPRDAWHSKRNLLRVLGPVDLQWSGSDENVQGVLRLIASREVPTLKGTTNLGYLETDNGPRWVTPDGVLAPTGETTEENIIYVSSGSTLGDRVRYKPNADPAVEAAAAAVILPKLLELNVPEVILPILGWFFAAPLKPRILKLLRHFPILMVWGSQGSGKSTTIMEVFWPMLGVVAADPYSATETEFALIKLLSSTNSVPIFIDEYKPYAMQRFRKNLLHRFMRRIYAGEVEERGRADQTLVTYRLSGPLCVAGETRPTESAVVERIIVSNPEKNVLEKTPAFELAYQKIQQVNPTLISTGIIRFLLSRDTESDMALAKKITFQLLENREVPFRVRDNLIVMILGLLCFEEYAASLEIAIPDLQIEQTVDKILKELLEGGGTSVKTTLDYFIEELSIMAIAGTLQHGRHYVYYDGFLALHFGACHAAYCEHARKTALDREVPDRKAMRRMIVEYYDQKGYVKDIDAVVCFNGRSDRRRAVLIDIEAAKSRLHVDDFPKPEYEASIGYRRWETD